MALIPCWSLSSSADSGGPETATRFERGGCADSISGRVRERKRNEPRTVFGISSSLEINCDRTIPTMAVLEENAVLNLPYPVTRPLSTHAPFSESPAWLR